MTGLFIDVSQSYFVDLFDKYSRQANFSREGRRQLYDYLQELSEITGEPIEVDVIALCCDYSECFVEDIQKEIGEDYTLENLSDYTTVIGPYTVTEWPEGKDYSVKSERIIYGCF